MKKTFFVVALVVTSFCCSRNIDTPDPTLATDPLYQSIAGKWNYTENGVSSGGPMQWLTVPAGEWIEFKSDGSVGTNIPAFSGVTSFQVLDSARVKILIPTFSKGYVMAVCCLRRWSLRVLKDAAVDLNDNFFATEVTE
jgi:hypothetical protein